MYYYSTDIHINMLHVAVFVTVFSTLGAVIDTALSVTSSVYEVWTHKNSLTAKELTSSGYQVGKEIIGTTVNTLLFAYLGGSILLFAYVQTQQYNLEIILNSKFLFSGCCNHAVWGDCLPFYSTGINQMCDSPDPSCCI